MRSLLAIVLLLSGYGWGLRAQDLTGQWTGTATDSKSDRKQKLVLSITEGDSAFGGVLHWYSPETQYIRHIIVSGRFYGKDSILTIREDSAINNLIQGGEAFKERPRVAGTGFYVLFYRRTAGRRDLLSGHWGFADSSGGSGDLEIRLEKKAPPFIPLPPLKKDSALEKKAQERESKVAANIPVRGIDTVRVELYDNGEIDGDSVSLFMNDQLLLQHVKLTAEPKVLLVPIDKSKPVNKLVLFAENLGRLPPNTALMQVTVHGKTYNLFLSTDFKKNAAVEFNLQE
ncbi:MAG: hypothetical protein JST68_12255 [Bacteroidetes bacterium]|nr:hypothetical protein [Bacteroidota bacterium]